MLRRSISPADTERYDSSETEECSTVKDDDVLLFESVKTELGQANVLARRARLVVQRVFSKVQGGYHSGMNVSVEVISLSY